MSDTPLGPATADADLQVFAFETDAACAVAPADIAGAAGSDFGVIQPHSSVLLSRALETHRLGGGRRRLTLIVPPREPPLDDRRRDEEVVSFLASREFLAEAHASLLPVRAWCFELMRRAIAGPRLDIDLRIVHRVEPIALPSIPTESFEAIVPHRGLERHLRLAVDSLRRQDTPSRIQVALDQASRCARFLADVRGDPTISVIQVVPNPLGPYVARHHLGHAAKTDFIAWQDSDDVSLPHRFRSLADAARREGAGLVGSHELVVDEVRRVVRATRYPLDASASLDRVGATHQMLFPMTMVRREVFEAVGGLSTHRTFSLDVNFWLAASLHTRLVNVDDFLYVRRRRAGSLTMRRDIGSNSVQRKGLIEQRTADYAAIRAGRLRFEDSSLALRHREGPVELRPLGDALVTRRAGVRTSRRTPRR